MSEAVIMPGIGSLFLVDFECLGTCAVLFNFKPQFYTSDATKINNTLVTL